MLKNQNPYLNICLIAYLMHAGDTYNKKKGIRWLVYLYHLIGTGESYIGIIGG